MMNIKLNGANPENHSLLNAVYNYILPFLQTDYLLNKLDLKQKDKSGLEEKVMSIFHKEKTLDDLGILSNIVTVKPESKAELPQAQVQDTDFSYSRNILYNPKQDNKNNFSLTYVEAILSYIKSLERSKNNFRDRVPGKFVSILPKSIMGGVLGFTYLGDSFMALRDDLPYETKEMVDIHESIHTNDEYETRILTDWIMSEERFIY
jgi:hypothetical protein